MYVQEVTAIATAILVTVCMFSAMFVRNEIRGEPEKPYLVAFYISAFLYFLTHQEVNQFDNAFVVKLVSINSVSSLAALLPLAICLAYRNNSTV